MVELIAPEQKQAGFALEEARFQCDLFAEYLRASLEPISSFSEDLPEKRESGSMTARSIAEASGENNQYFKLVPRAV